MPLPVDTPGLGLDHPRMVSIAASLAFILPGWQEMSVILVVGIVLFGRRLPEVGKAIGRAMIQMRQGLQKLKDEMDLDSDVREVVDTIRNTRNSLTSAVDAPRSFTDPGTVLQNLTDESLASPGPAIAVGDVRHSLFESEQENGQDS